MPISAHDVGANWCMSGWRGSHGDIVLHQNGHQSGILRTRSALKITAMNRLNWKNIEIHLRARLWRSSMTWLKAQSSLNLVRGLGYKVIRWAERRERRNKVGAWSMLDPCKACIIITMEADHSWYNGLERSPEDTADRSTVPGQDSRLQLQLKNRYLQCRPDWQIDSSKCLCNWEVVR